MQASSILDRVLVLEMVRVTEAAAIAASKLIGRGDEKAADPHYNRCEAENPVRKIVHSLFRRQSVGLRIRIP